MSKCFPKPYEPFGGDINIEVNVFLCNENRH